MTAFPPARAGIPPGWATMDQDARDAAYNNTASVADVLALHAERGRASERRRAEPGATLDVRYGPGPRNLIDVFAGRDPGAPCLVFIHGGYWQMNSKESFACLGDGVRAHGWSAAFPGYTLAPDASLGGIVSEIDAALDFLADWGPAHGLGPLVVAGWSAGGHLATLALRHPSVATGLSISGLHELAPLRDTYLNDRLRLSDAEIDHLSPLRLPVVRKPFAIAYGSEELPALALNSRAFHAYRAAHGGPGPLIEVAGRHHFTILDELRGPDGLLTRSLLALNG